MVKEVKNTRPVTRASKKKEEQNRKLKENESTDDSDDNYISESDEDEIDMVEYRKFLAKIYPSKHINKKVEAGESLKKAIKNDLKSQDIQKQNTQKQNIQKQNIQKQNIQKQNIQKQNIQKDVKKNIQKDIKKNIEKKSETESESESESETEYEDETESSDNSATEDEDEDDNDYEEEEKEVNKIGKFNIIFTIGGPKREELEEDESEEEDDELENNNDEPENNNDNNENKVTNENNDLLVLLKSLQEKDKTNNMVNECIKVCEEKIKDDKEQKEKLVKKEKSKNGKVFRKMLYNKNVLNDFDFFDNLEVTNQKKIINELKEINKIIKIDKPYRLALLEADIPVKFKSVAMKKISTLRNMEQGSGEYYKIKNWVDTFMKIPFGKYNTLPINISDGVDKCHEFMENSQKILNDAVYGMNDAKMQIMQMLGQLITNPNALGTAIAIHGSPGTGKTSIVKDGISKILNRPFAFIALGGATDSSFLDGHSYTYEGSTWGKIVQIIIESKCMNPVIYFDELDKISDTPKGEEIIGILTHLTDTTQNSQFHDKYFTEIDFDLSKCLFIFSYNDETKVNPILKDRMYRIQTKGYNQNQKLVIANNYLLPKIREQVYFTNQDIIIPDNTLNYIIENYCNKEDGVRNLKRCLEIVYTKLNLYRLMRPNTNLFEEDMTLNVEFPFTVTREVVDKLIKNNKENNGVLHSMYI
jgi:ATP-dependent Lon protease